MALSISMNGIQKPDQKQYSDAYQDKDKDRPSDRSPYNSQHSALHLQLVQARSRGFTRMKEPYPPLDRAQAPCITPSPSRSQRCLASGAHSRVRRRA